MIMITESVIIPILRKLAGFCAQLYGLIIIPVSALPIMPWKFIALGAVMVGLADRNKFGRVALVGSLTNLVMGISFLIST